MIAEEVKRIQKRSTHVDPYTQIRNGKVVDISGYDKKLIAQIVTKLQAGEHVQLPDGKGTVWLDGSGKLQHHPQAPSKLGPEGARARGSTGPDTRIGGRVKPEELHGHMALDPQGAAIHAGIEAARESKTKGMPDRYAKPHDAPVDAAQKEVDKQAAQAAKGIDWDNIGNAELEKHLRALPEGKKLKTSNGITIKNTRAGFIIYDGIGERILPSASQSWSPIDSPKAAAKRLLTRYDAKKNRKVKKVIDGAVEGFAKSLGGTFTENLHPRAPKGHTGGGRFAPKGSTQPANPQERRAKLAAMLHQLGYLKGNDASGKNSKALDAAIEEFKSQHGHTGGGIEDKSTRLAIRHAHANHRKGSAKNRRSKKGKASGAKGSVPQ